MNNSSMLSEDERLARALYQEERDEQLARDLQVQIEREAELASRFQYQHTQDAVVAQALEQELQDEDLARQLALQEEQAVAAATATNNNRAARSTKRRVCTASVPCLIVATGVGVLYFFLGGNHNAAGPQIPRLPFLRDSDPFQGLGPNEVARWKTNGRSGLNLVVLNALEEHWHDEFAAVLVDWNQSIALDLTVELISPDPDCEPVDGYSKVCNGDYGPTDWKGINMAVTNFGYIFASTSRVNEFYLAADDTTEKRYTLCHEIGHSFGLPHTDEDFFNADLGNCMDYTSNPGANLHPDETNFAFLADLYGVIPGKNTATSTMDDATDVTQQALANEGPGNRRTLLQPTNTSTIPISVRSAMQHIFQQEIRTDSNRFLRQTSNTIHNHNDIIEIQDGWAIRVQKLL